MNARTAGAIGLSLATSLLATAAIATPCQASWAYVPQEIRIMQSDLVVVGTITKQAKNLVKNGRTYSTGVIQPTATLNGQHRLAGDIRVAWPAARQGLAVSTDIAYKVGQKGVWVLTLDKVLPIYWATYPSDYQPLARLADFRRKLANLKNVQWGRAVNGLQVGLIVEQRDMRNQQIKVDNKPIKAIGQLSVYPLLKNVTDKSIQVVDHVHDRPVSIVFRGSDNQPIKVNLYGNLPQQDIAPKAHNFRAILPGGACTLGYGYGLPICTESGSYSITFAYKNQRDGSALHVEGVWRGEAASPTVRVDVPARPVVPKPAAP